MMENNNSNSLSMKIFLQQHQSDSMINGGVLCKRVAIAYFDVA